MPPKSRKKRRGGRGKNASTPRKSNAEGSEAREQAPAAEGVDQLPIARQEAPAGQAPAEHITTESSQDVKAQNEKGNGSSGRESVVEQTNGLSTACEAAPISPPTTRNSEQFDTEEAATVAETAPQQAAEEEAARQKAAQEEAARQQAAEEEAARQKAAEEAARQRAAEEEAARQKAAEEAARQKAAEEAAARQKAAEEAARQKAAEEAARQKAAEEAARQRAAEEEAARQKAAEEAARQRAAEEEAARQKAAEEEAARQRAARAAAAKDVARVEVNAVAEAAVAAVEEEVVGEAVKDRRFGRTAEKATTLSRTVVPLPTSGETVQPENDRSEDEDCANQESKHSAGNADPTPGHFSDLTEYAIAAAAAAVVFVAAAFVMRRKRW